MKRGRLDFEIRRKLFHTLFGLFLIFTLFHSGRISLIIFLIIFLILGSILIVLMQQGRKIRIADWFEEKFEREYVRFPGYGAFWYVVGTLLLVLSLNNANEIAAAIVALAAGDSAATIFGIRVGTRFPTTGSKPWRDQLHFLSFLCRLVCLWAGWV